jgi:hypothetical protein
MTIMEYNWAVRCGLGTRKFKPLFAVPCINSTAVSSYESLWNEFYFNPHTKTQITLLHLYYWVEILLLLLLFTGAYSPGRTFGLHFRGLLITHIQTHGRTLLDEWSARRRSLYLHRTTQHINTTDKHPCPQRDSNPRPQQPSDRRLTP